MLQLPITTLKNFIKGATMLKIFITDLAAYTQGFLIGEWITLPKEKEELIEDINRILGTGERICEDYPHEEFFTTDYEWSDVEIFPIGEYDNLDELNQKLNLIEEVDESDHIKLKFLLDNNLVSSLEEAIEKIDDVIYHQDSTMRDIAEEYIYTCYDLDTLPKIIAHHIDYDGIARDLEIDGSFYQEGLDIFEYLG